MAVTAAILADAASPIGQCVACAGAFVWSAHNRDRVHGISLELLAVAAMLRPGQGKAAGFQIQCLDKQSKSGVTRYKLME